MIASRNYRARKFFAGIIHSGQCRISSDICESLIVEVITSSVLSFKPYSNCDQTFIAVGDVLPKGEHVFYANRILECIVRKEL